MGSVNQRLQTHENQEDQSWPHTVESSIAVEDAAEIRKILVSVKMFAPNSLSFFSLVFLFPWCFSCCDIPWSFGVFSAYFPGFLRVRKVREILGVFEVFLGIFEKTKDRRTGFWGRKWLRQFYGRLEKCVLSAGKPPCP